MNKWRDAETNALSWDNSTRGGKVIHAIILVTNIRSYEA